jgi:hypothetical protein
MPSTIGAQSSTSSKEEGLKVEDLPKSNAAQLEIAQCKVTPDKQPEDLAKIQVVIPMTTPSPLVAESDAADDNLIGMQRSKSRSFMQSLSSQHPKLGGLVSLDQKPEVQNSN